MSLNDFDWAGFWEPSDYATQEYVDEPLTPALLERVERVLGYRLPSAYIELARYQNGGLPARTCHPTAEPTSWAKDHISIFGIKGIGETKPFSLIGERGSPFWMDEWRYPAIGVYFADCPSAGHDMVCLDYSECGPMGEPRVVHVDQEEDYKVTLVAPDFETFIRGLVDEGEFDVDD